MTEPTTQQPDTAPTAPQVERSAAKRARGKGKALKPVTAPHTPTIDDFPDLPTKERTLLQAYLLEPIQYRASDGRPHYVTVKRKIYYWWRLKKRTHIEALKLAGLDYNTSHSRMLSTKSATALRAYWKVNDINLDWVLSELVTVIKSKQNANSTVKALKLITELRGWYATHHVIDINEQLQVQFSMSGPVLCPHCQRNTLQPPGTAQAQLPSEVLSAEYVPSEQGDSA